MIKPESSLVHVPKSDVEIKQELELRIKSEVVSRIEKRFNGQVNLTLNNFIRVYLNVLFQSDIDMEEITEPVITLLSKFVGVNWSSFKIDRASGLGFKPASIDSKYSSNLIDAVEIAEPNLRSEKFAEMLLKNVGQLEKILTIGLAGNNIEDTLTQLLVATNSTYEYEGKIEVTRRELMDIHPDRNTNFDEPTQNRFDRLSGILKSLRSRKLKKSKNLADFTELLSSNAGSVAINKTAKSSITTQIANGKPVNKYTSPKVHESEVYEILYKSFRDGLAIGVYLQNNYNEANELIFDQIGVEMMSEIIPVQQVDAELDELESDLRALKSSEETLEKAIESSRILPLDFDNYTKDLIGVKKQVLFFEKKIIAYTKKVKPNVDTVTKKNASDVKKEISNQIRFLQEFATPLNSINLTNHRNHPSLASNYVKNCLYTDSLGDKLTIKIIKIIGHHIQNKI